VRHSTFRFALLAGALAMIVTTGSCGDDSDSPPQPGTDVPVRVVVLGSSTAFGIGPHDPNNIWVARYRVFLDSLNADNEVVNLAFPGYTTYQVLPTTAVPPADRPLPDPERNITRALASAPSVIIVNLPSNDVAFGFSLAEQLANYGMIRTEAERAGVPLWITTPQPRNLDAAGREALDALLEASRREFADRLLDFWTDLAADDGSVRPEYDSGDGIHLNDAAHAILARRVEESRILERVASTFGFSRSRAADRGAIMGMASR